MGNILVVDDSVVVRRSLGFILARTGHAVRFACDGEEGLAAIREQRPDLVLTDLEMPVMDGIAFVGQVRADPAIRSIPIVMLSATGDDQHRRAIAGLELQGFAAKPVQSTQVLELVDQLVGVG